MDANGMLDYAGAVPFVYRAMLYYPRYKIVAAVVISSILRSVGLSITTVQPAE